MGSIAPVGRAILRIPTLSRPGMGAQKEFRSLEGDGLEVGCERIALYAPGLVDGAPPLVLADKERNGEREGTRSCARR